MDSSSPQHKGFLLILGLVTVAFFWLLLPFYGAVLWAVILAIVFQPVQRWLLQRLGSRNLAAALNVALCVVIAIIPVTIAVGSLVGQVGQIVGRVQRGELDAAAMLSDLLAVLPERVRHWLDSLGVGDLAGLRERLSAVATQIGEFLAGRAVNVGQDTLHLIVSTGIMLYVLFFLFRDGPAIGRNIREALPLSDDYSRRLIGMFTAVVRATIKGNIVIALAQGTIGGVAFWALGIGAPLLWGVLMTLLSLVPAVGAALVWMPAAVWLAASGAITKAAILVVVGIAGIGLVDNLLRPRLVGKETRLPDYVVLVSTVGGLSLMGVNGFVLGPMIAALFLACWTLYRDEQRGAPPSVP